MSEMSNVFQRWVRLKQEATTAPRSEAVSKGLESVVPQAGFEAAKNEPFDPASLPSIDAITAATNIIAFLQSDVPAELTRAALRRAWTSDPAIRDFVGIAEDQWDFNDPNGTPGFGPLGQVACRSQVSPSLPDLLAGEMSPVAHELSAADQCAHSGLGELHSTGVSSREICEESAENEDVIGQYHASRGGRPHGSALPR